MEQIHEAYAKSILDNFVQSELPAAKFEPEKLADVMRRVIFKNDMQVEVYEKGKTIYLTQRGFKLPEVENDEGFSPDHSN